MLYPKINSIFKRDLETKKFTCEYSVPEFMYLRDNLWEFTEKIDGENTRVNWDGVQVRFGGKTDNAHMSVKLLDKLGDLFLEDNLRSVFPGDAEKKILPNVTLFGEGFGLGIQSGGKYLRDGVDFILFDVYIENKDEDIPNPAGWWLNQRDVEDVAKKLGIREVKVVGEGTLDEGINLVKSGFNSEFGNFLAEGIVLKPKVQLFNRKGERIITKIKHKDFKV